MIDFSSRNLPDPLFKASLGGQPSLPSRSHTPPAPFSLWFQPKYAAKRFPASPERCVSVRFAYQEGHPWAKAVVSFLVSTSRHWSTSPPGLRVVLGALGGATQPPALFIGLCLDTVASDNRQGCLSDAKATDKFIMLRACTLSLSPFFHTKPNSSAWKRQGFQRGGDKLGEDSLFGSFSRVLCFSFEPHEHPQPTPSGPGQNQAAQAESGKSGRAGRHRDFSDRQVEWLRDKTHVIFHVSSGTLRTGKFFLPFLLSVALAQFS